MDFLTLVKRTWLKCGLSGTAPASVVNQRDMAGRIVAYVEDAYRFIQMQHPMWNFHLMEAAGALAPGVALYRPADLNIADFRLPRRVLAHRDGRWQIIPHQCNSEDDDFLNLVEGTPDRMVFSPSGIALFNRLPLAAETLSITYFRTPHIMVANTDQPIIPEPYHNIIVAKAVEYYAHYDADAALAQEVQREFTQAMLRMELHQLPPMQFGDPQLFFKEP